MEIVIFGAGYVGTVTGACLAKLGHRITFVDPNMSKVEAINAGKTPVLEPGLENLLQEGLQTGSLNAKHILEDDLLEADMVMIAVATPSHLNGILQLATLTHVLETIRDAVINRTRPLTVVIRSTVHFLALRRLMHMCQLANHPIISLVVNPEFLRESTAVEDFFHAPICVAGGDNSDHVASVLSLYEQTCSKRFAVDLETASLLKYACNAFHALKIAFTNEIASLCDLVNINPLELMEIFCQDEVLNCSRSYLKPGFSFGGSCLPKDLRSLLSLGRELGESMPLLSTILPSNQLRFQTMIEKILQSNHSSLAILGLSFKKNSDDLRESPFVELVEILAGKGIKLKIFDRDVQTRRLLGSNLIAFNTRTAHLAPCLQDSLAKTLEGCDGIVICKNFIDDVLIDFIEENNIPVYDLGYFLMQKTSREENRCFV